MAIYMIGYDLNKAGKNYEGLIAKIKEVSTLWWHHLDSTWLITSSSGSVAIRDALRPYIDSDDELLVVAVSTGDAAWAGFSADGSNWLKNNL